MSDPNHLPGYDFWKTREPGYCFDIEKPLATAPSTAVFRLAETLCEDSQLGYALARWACQNGHLLPEEFQDELNALLVVELQRLGVERVALTLDELNAERETSK
jgi:hypothetical protein